MIRITIQALFTRVLTAKHGHQVVFELINAILNQVIIKNTNLVCVVLKVLIIIWILNLESELHFPGKLIVLILLIEAVDKSLKDDLTSAEEANTVNSNVVESYPAFFWVGIDHWNFERHQHDNAC